MINPLRRLFTREAAPTARRSLDAAAGGRRWRDAPTIASPNQSLLAGHRSVAHRARASVMNNPWASRAVDTLAANLVGPSGIMPQSEHPDRELRRVIDELWRRWSEECDSHARTTFAGLQSQVVRSMVVDGESLVRLRPRRPEDGLAVPLQLQMIPSDDLDVHQARELGNGRIVAGIEFDSLDRRRAYHVRRGPLSPETTRVPAEDILHVFEPLSPGQVRGLSWFAPVLLRLQDLDKYEDAQLLRQQIAAMHAGFVVDMSGGTGGYSGEQTGNDLVASLEPGTMQALPPGTDVKFSEPPQLPSEYEAFLRWQLRAVAAGVGCTFEMITGDMSQVNYSSARVGLLEFRRRIEALQQQVVIPQFCAPAWRRFIDLAVLSGLLPADEAVYAVSWIRPSWDWIDPKKDIEAEALAVQHGFKSRAEVISERGRDPEHVDEQIAADTFRQPAPKESQDAVD